MVLAAPVLSRAVVVPMAETRVLVVPTTLVAEVTVEVADRLVLVAAASEAAPVEVRAAVSAVFEASEVDRTVLVDDRVLAFELRTVLVDRTVVAWAFTMVCAVTTSALAVEATVETDDLVARAEVLVLVAVDRAVEAEAIVVALPVSSAEL